MMIFAVLFFVPQAMMFSELGSALPMEGGPYYWTRLAFGHLAGAVNNFLYWITNPVWIGGSLTISCIAAVELFFNGGRNLPTVAWFIVALAFVWLSILAASMSFSVAKWLPTAGAFARFILLGLFTLSVIIFAVKHGVHGLRRSRQRLGRGHAQRRRADPGRRLRAGVHLVPADLRRDLDYGVGPGA